MDGRIERIMVPGSACSIAFGTGLSPMEPGSQRGIQVVVEDAEAARAALVEAGVETTDADQQPWGTFVFFNDPDGNAWTLQEATPPPG